MIELTHLKNMGLSGVNSDVAPWELPPEFLTHGVNFRARDGKLTPFSGSYRAYDAPSPIVQAGVLKHIRTKTSDFWMSCNRTSVQAISHPTVGWVDVSSGPYTINEGEETQWTVSQLGQVAVVNHVEVGPEYWIGGGAEDTLKSLPFSPTQTWEETLIRCEVMRSHKNFLIALNLSGQEVVPNGLRISHPASENGIPFTWDTTDRSSIAVQTQLGGDGAEIVDGLTLRDDFIIYSRDSIDVLTFNPASEFFWTRRELSSTVGLLAKNCITEVKGTHFFIADGDIVSNDGSSIKSLLHGRLISRFNANTNEYTSINSFVCRNDALSEVWFCVPEGSSKTANVAYIYNWRDDSIVIRDLPANLVSADYGKDPSSLEGEDSDSWDSPESLDGSWSDEVSAWGSSRLTALDDALLGLLATGAVVNIDPKGTIQETGLNTIMERTSFPLAGHRQTCTVSRVYLHASGDPFKFQLGSQQQPGGPVNWSKEMTFNPGSQRKIDVRRTGELFSWRILSTGTNRFKLSGLNLEYSRAGFR